MSAIKNFDNLFQSYPQTQIFTKKEVSKILSVSLSTIDNYLGFENGKLNYIKFDSKNKSTIRITKEDLIVFLNSKCCTKDIL